MASPHPSLRPGSYAPPRDAGRLLARLLCVLFALIGLIPPLAGALTRWTPVRDWAAIESARVLRQELGLDASYAVELSLWPLGLELRDVTLRASGGGPPVLEAPRLSVRPRLFSLLGGRVDAGQISVESPVVHLRVEDGKLANLELELPEGGGARTRPPLDSLAVTDARIVAEIDGTSIEGTGLDLDVFAEAGDAWEVALRAGTTRVVRERAAKAPLATALDEDVLCQTDARVRIEPNALLVRRLSLMGAVDRAPEPGTAPSCELESISNNDARLLMRLSSLRLEHHDGELGQLTGHVLLQAPLEVASRYTTAGPFSGWVQVSGELDVSSRTKFPEFHGRLRTGRVGLGPYLLAAHADAELHLVRDRLLVNEMRAGYADGDVLLQNISLDLGAPGLPLRVEKTTGTGVTFPGLMRDVDVTPNTIVNWDLDHLTIDEFSGTLDPPILRGKLRAETKNFEVFDRSVHDPEREHMIGVPRAVLSGTFGVHGDSVRFDGMRAEFGKSVLFTTVHIGYDNTIELSVPEGSVLELADASPLIDIPLAGAARLALRMSGPMSTAELTGALGITDLWFAGFPIGNVSTKSVRFVPLVVEVAEATLQKGASEYQLGRARLDFDTDATLVATAEVESQRLELRDFFAMWHFDEDPRWDGISGKGGMQGRLEYVLGGPRDRCRSGKLEVRGELDLAALELFEERYSRAAGAFAFDWFDIEASYHGMRLDVPSLMLRKGPGAVLGSLRVSPGARVHGELIATGVPVSELQALGALGKAAVGSVSAEAKVNGTLDALALDARARITPLRMGRSELPASQLSVQLVPVVEPERRIGSTACGGPVFPGFERSVYDADRPAGVFRVSGELFGGQLRLHEVEVTRQRSKHVRGRVDAKNLDLLALSNLSPAPLGLEAGARAELDAQLRLADLALDRPLSATGALDLTRLELDYAGIHVDAARALGLELANGTLRLPGMTLQARTATGQTALFDLGGSVTELGQKPNLDLRLSMQPTALDGFVGLIPGAERARGLLGGQLAVTGTLDAPVYRGRFELTNGAVELRNSPQSVSELDLRLAVVPGELIIEQGAFSIGGGRVSVRGNAPLTGLTLGEFRAFITAKDVALPLGPDVKASVDAELRARWQPSAAPGAQRKQALPQLVGNVVLDSLVYSRPVKMSANITDLAARGRRTEVDAYQPEADFVSFDINVRATKPLVLQNNLIDASLTIEDDVLELAGTNQRFGVRGALRIAPGGRIRLTKSEFEIQQGRVRFEDPTRIAPLVDVTAVTEYRRYGGNADATTNTTTSAASTSGDWRISMHAHGDAETLRIDLTSQPALPQDDIFLLLTLGLTRAELDQVQSSRLGESVALEALGALTGADQVVTEAIPVIDEFRLGSFSSRSGRTEPAVTIGKRLSERIRAYVTSGLSESRDVRSNVEVKINREVSIEGSYDNVNDITSSTLGNLGADIRWRLDFQ